MDQLTSKDYLHLRNYVDLPEHAVTEEDHDHEKLMDRFVAWCEREEIEEKVEAFHMSIGDLVERMDEEIAAGRRQTWRPMLIEYDAKFEGLMQKFFDEAGITRQQFSAASRHALGMAEQYIFVLKGMRDCARNATQQLVRAENRARRRAAKAAEDAAEAAAAAEVAAAAKAAADAKAAEEAAAKAAAGIVDPPVEFYTKAVWTMLASGNYRPRIDDVD